MQPRRRDKLVPMLSLLVARIVVRIVATVPPTTDEVAPAAPAGDSLGSSTADVFSAVIDNLGDNGYHTGIALIVMTAAVIAMLNLKVHYAIIVPVAIGAFWAGWLAWNTITAQNNPLFPGDVSATKLWDVGLTGDTGFLLVALVACGAAVFLWRKSAALYSRLLLLLGAVLGASFFYNLIEAVRLA